MKYIKKPEIIEAIQFTKENRYSIQEDLFKLCGSNLTIHGDKDGIKYLHIENDDIGWRADFGDYIVKTEENELCVYHSKIFEQYYELLLEDNTINIDEFLEKDLENIPDDALRTLLNEVIVEENNI